MKNFHMLFILAMSLVATSVFAQPPQAREKIESLRVGVYTRVLNLTAAEAKNFWPVFNQYQAELSALRKQMRVERKEAHNDFDSMTDAQVEAVIDKGLEYEQKELDLKKEYIEKFKKVLPIRKVAMLPGAERQFKRELLDQIRDKREHMHR